MALKCQYQIYTYNNNKNKTLVIILKEMSIFSMYNAHVTETSFNPPKWLSV